MTAPPSSVPRHGAACRHDPRASDLRPPDHPTRRGGGEESGRGGFPAQGIPDPGASGLDQAVADRVADQVRNVVNAELLHHLRAVRLHRLDTDPKEGGDLPWRLAFDEELRAAVDAALRVTVMAFLIILGSATFSQLLAFSGASSGLIGWATRFEVSSLGMLAIMIGLIFLLGCFMDQLSMMLLTAPIFFPLAKTLGFDLTWFGLIMLLALEVGYTTPPFGLLLFVMKGVAPPGTTMRQIYFAAAPFIACVLVLIGLIIAFPPLATWLPGISR